PDTETIMNALITSSHLSPLITTAIVGAFALSCSTVSTAADQSDAPQAVVKFADLNISTQQGAAALYGRIAAAADKVCYSYAVDIRDLVAQAGVKACVNKAIADAVTKVGQPKLFAIYSAKNHRPLPNLVATAQNR
ncbi:MAG: UrcA family protein, partial [Steroidobacteraceae bacterium]